MSAIHRLAPGPEEEEKGEVTEMSLNPRYIKAQEAEERIVALCRKEKGAYADTFNTAIDACQTIILDMYDNSSPDVVPVVRCKDCQLCTVTELRELYCYRLEDIVGAEDYCSKAKRKEDG